ncbi:MAG: hypothetical protein V4663_16755 [Bacteroidota bacterium]
MIRKDQALEIKTKHLEFILQIINRMGNNSFLLKGWAITLNAAIIGLVIKDHVNYGWAIGLVSGYLFWLIDSYFLSVERKYRSLYDAVRENTIKDLKFSLDVTNFKETKHSIFGCFVSLNLLMFYGTIAIINIGLKMIAN